MLYLKVIYSDYILRSIYFLYSLYYAICILSLISTFSVLVLLCKQYTSYTLTNITTSYSIYVHSKLLVPLPFLILCILHLIHCQKLRHFSISIHLLLSTLTISLLICTLCNLCTSTLTYCTHSIIVTLYNM